MEVQFFYSLADVPHKIFIITIPKKSTCQEVLKLINEKKKSSYTTIYYEESEIELDDDIYDFMEGDPNYIFFISKDSGPIPQNELIENINQTDYIKEISSEGSDSEDSKSDSEEILFESSESEDSNSSKQSNSEESDSCNDSGSQENSDTNSTLLLKELIQEDDNSISEKYVFFLAGSTIEHLFDGINIRLNSNMNKNDCLIAIKKILNKKNIDIKNKKVLLYLPGALPFNDGKLGDIFYADGIVKVLFGVICESISDEILEEKVIENLNVNDQNHQKILSPIVESTTIGLCNIACFLCYLIHHGLKTQLFYQTFSKAIQFPPFNISMSKLNDGCEIYFKDIVTVCSTLFTFFRACLPDHSKVPDEKIFEYTFHFCSLISNSTVFQSNKLLPIAIHTIDADDVNPRTEKNQSFYNLGQYSVNYIWEFDVLNNFEYDSFDIENFKGIEKALEIKQSFRPLSPLSMKYISDYCVVKGKDHNYLFLLFDKDSEKQRKAKIYDPITGRIELKDVEEFAEEQENVENDDLLAVVNPNQIKQVIVVNFDESESMKTEINGIPRYLIAEQLLAIFSQKIKDSCLGLVTFNDEIKMRSKLNLIVSDFEKGLNEIEPNSVSKLWDSILFRCNEIIKFKQENEISKDKSSRILVISNGEDSGSISKVENVVKILKENNIVVDSVVLSGERESNMLCAACHATRGLSFNIKKIDEGFSIFNTDPFIDITDRRKTTNPLHKGLRVTIPSRVRPEQITEAFMNKAMEDAEFDTDVSGKSFTQNASIKILTTKKMCSLNEKKFFRAYHPRRILHETFLLLQVCDPDSINYDPGMKIFHFGSTYNLNVFLAGPDNSPYQDKWWNLKVNFPAEYPVRAPEIKFISVPYHLNVSKEGQICLYEICDGYSPSISILTILKKIKKLLSFPSPENAIDIQMLTIYNNDRAEYKKLARESADMNAKDDYMEYISNVKIIDDKNYSSLYSLNGKTPPELYEKIQSKKLDKKHRLYKASSGAFYFLDELIDILKSSDNPVCIVTGNPLTEKLEDLEKL